MSTITEVAYDRYFNTLTYHYYMYRRYQKLS